MIDLNDVKLSSLNGLTVRFMVACQKLNIITVGDLLKTKPVDVLRVKGIGRKTLEKDSKTLEEDFGIQWKYFSPRSCPYCHTTLDGTENNAQS